MRTVHRPRTYVAGHWITLMRPILRYSTARDAYVLRGVGRDVGPVLRVDRRRENLQHRVERRRHISATAPISATMRAKMPDMFMSFPRWSRAHYRTPGCVQTLSLSLTRGLAGALDARRRDALRDGAHGRYACSAGMSRGDQLERVQARAVIVDVRDHHQLVRRGLG